MSERQTLANMAIEAGAKNAIMKTDEKVHSYLAEHGREDEFQPLAPDRDADYEEIIHIDASSLEPVVSVPHGVDNVEPISGVESESIAVDQVYLGSCTNGRIDDFEIAADILSRNDVAPDVRIVATPGSREIYKKGIRRGIWETLVDAGALVNSPGCGACPGVHTGILGDDEICLASINRNYKGRMGNPEASVFLASPATCAYSAVNGYISSPEGFFQ